MFQPDPAGDEREGVQQPQGGDDDRGGGEQYEDLDGPVLAAQPVGPGVVLAARVSEDALGPGELGGEDREAGEDDEPAGAGVRDGDDPGGEDGGADDTDADLPGPAPGGPFLDPCPERGDASGLLAFVGLLAQISTCPVATTFVGTAGSALPGSREIAYPA
ncbi:hypothetical protein PSU4_18300 [Pseudonocardia sulfidoxydans NBRC 16205]|uniref:Uncharacterized protein n=1 Tax=Pseudonocardia sulfidoxydans NBRC 16205 TaxID=1223511 RepID=A0A511DDK0_9PSEU|nr:hypothetical protein PSU4_18300 [Pseudonocardia sulfidoxydans NBRC 16205]